jgi:phytoene desaturase
MKHIVVVGAGFGGMATAARLAHRGHRVTVLEKNTYVGGRNRRLMVGQCRFDSGPTLLMMLDPFRKLFADLGESFDDLCRPQLCDPSYRVYWRDGSKLDATTHVERMTERMRALVGDHDADRYPGFLQNLKALYDDSIPHFVRKNYRGLADFAAPAQLSRVVRHGMLGNLASRVNRTFHDPRVQMLMSFQSMYLGLSPFDAPFVYATLAYMEYGEGIFYPEGGLGKMSETIAGLAKARGAEIRLGVEVAEINKTSVHTLNGETVQADAVVVNADLPYSQRKLESNARRQLRSSCSAHLLYMDYAGELPALEHHNVFFGADYRDNLDSLFHHLQVPSDPAFYVCASCKSDPTAAPAGSTNLFVLVPVPNLDYRASDAEMKCMEQTVLKRLECEAGFDPQRVRTIERRGPNEWASELNLDRGAAFGISADLFQSAFMRPQNRSKQKGVYYVGASTVPGNGLPMVLISAELAEDQLLHDGVI